MKERSVVISPEARVDLFEIYDCIADASFPKTALAYVERIEAFCLRLSIASERGQLREDIRPNLRIVGFERRVNIAFTVADTTVAILRVFYGGRNWEELVVND